MLLGDSHALVLELLLCKKKGPGSVLGTFSVPKILPETLERHRQSVLTQLTGGTSAFWVGGGWWQVGPCMARTKQGVGQKSGTPGHFDMCQAAHICATSSDAANSSSPIGAVAVLPRIRGII